MKTKKKLTISSPQLKRLAVEKSLNGVQGGAEKEKWDATCRQR